MAQNWPWKKENRFFLCFSHVVFLLLSDRSIENEKREVRAIKFANIDIGAQKQMQRNKVLDCIGAVIANCKYGKFQEDSKSTGFVRILD